MTIFFKNKSIKNKPGIFIWISLDIYRFRHMSEAFDDRGVKQKFENVFIKVDFSILLLLIGVVFICTIQSSSQ